MKTETGKKRKRSSSESAPPEKNQKLQIESGQESRTSFARFVDNLETILCNFENAEESKVANNVQLSEDDLLVGVVLKRLAKRLTEIKYSDSQELSTFDQSKLVKFLNILVINICNGRSPLGSDYQTEEIHKVWHGISDEALLNVMEACCVCMLVMTCPNMPKRIYTEEVIDSVVLFIKYLVKNIFIREGPNQSNGKMTKRRKCSYDVVSSLHSKIPDILNMLFELLQIQILSKHTVSDVLFIGLHLYFSNDFEKLLLQCIKILTKLLICYETLQKPFLETILVFLCRMVCQKRDDVHKPYIFILELFQSLVCDSLNTKQIPNEVNALLCKTYKKTVMIICSFVTMFLNKCLVEESQSEAAFKLFLERFLQYILCVFHKPEWPVAKVLLKTLGSVLLKSLSDKPSNVSWRVSCLGFVTFIAEKFREDFVDMPSISEELSRILKKLGYEKFNAEYDDTKEAIDEDMIKDRFLSKIILEFLDNYRRTNSSDSALYFFMVQRYCHLDEKLALIPAKNGTAKGDKKLTKRKKKVSSQVEKDSIVLALEDEKKSILLKVFKFEGKHRKHVDDDTAMDYQKAETVVRYLTVQRESGKRFQHYFKAIITELASDVIAVKIKALKCLVTLIEVDPTLLQLDEVQKSVNKFVMDPSPAVREAALILIGKSVIAQPQLLDKYYNTLSTQMSDSSVSVRKRVIVIFSEVAANHPNHTRVSDMYSKIVKKITDEDGVTKLVAGVLNNVWFTSYGDLSSLQTQVDLLVNVLSKLMPDGIEAFERLLREIFCKLDIVENRTKKKNPPKTQIVKKIIGILMKRVSSTQNGNHIEILLTALYVLAKVIPECFRKHCLEIKALSSRSNNKHAVTLAVKILHLMVFDMDDLFAKELQYELVTLITSHDRQVIESSVLCLEEIVNKITRNYGLVYLLMKRLLTYLKDYKDSSESGDKILDDHPLKNFFRRSIFTVGSLVQSFNFEDSCLFPRVPHDIINQIYDVIAYFLKMDDADIQYSSLQAIGFICSRHHAFMMSDDLKSCYRGILTKCVPPKLKIAVLNNVEHFLLQEDKKMYMKEKAQKNPEDDDLKKMCDIETGTSSTIIQCYLMEILQSYVHEDTDVRKSAFKVIQLIVKQALVHFVKLAPYLMCMGTDPDEVIAHEVKQAFLELESRYPGFSLTNSPLGFELSYKLQKLIHCDEIVRGFCITQEKDKEALLGFVFKTLKSKQRKRLLLMNVLKNFDDKSVASLEYKLYLADNLAYFPYLIQDEVLFVIYNIDVMVSTAGTNILQMFSEGLMNDRQRTDLPRSDCNNNFASTLDEEQDNEDDLVARIPGDTKHLQNCVMMAQGYLLLLNVKQHLKITYGLNDLIIQKYSPYPSSKLYDKNMTRRKKSSYNTKTTLDRLKDKSSSSKTLNEAGKRALIKFYLEFKKLMVQFDKEMDDWDD